MYLFDFQPILHLKYAKQQPEVVKGVAIYRRLETLNNDVRSGDRVCSFQSVCMIGRCTYSFLHFHNYWCHTSPLITSGFDGRL